MTYKISEEKELEYFLATIEEASKHARSLFFILMLTSIYVVVAAYTGDWQSETLILPIVEAEISRRWFFVISPVFILFNYVYFHLYLKDLMTRREIYYNLDVETSLIDKTYFTYPWILPVKDTDRDPKTRSFARKFLGFWVNILFWWYGPAVLLAILMAYIFQQDVAALVPYICFCLSIIHYVMNSRFEKSNYKKFLMGYLTVFLLFITLTAVPAIPQFFGFEAIESEEFSSIVKFFVKTYFIIYFALFAIPKTWRSECGTKMKALLILLYIIGIIFFAGSFIQINVTL